jgi:hypothetical protein
MTETMEGTRNTAERGSRVGIQAEQVHNSNVYQVFHDTPPSEIYDIGMRFLEEGVPARARELIADAISRGYVNSEVRFNWVLAMLSKRAYRDLTVEERDQLGKLPDFLGRYPEDEWKRALEAIHELLECLHGSRGEPGGALKRIADLAKLQRDQILLHLDLVLTGSAKDNLWAEARETARAAQYSRDRVNRVWTYFQPDPVEARARRPAPSSTTPSDQGQAGTWTLFVVGASWYLGSAVLANVPPALAVSAFVIALGGGFFGFHTGWEWRYRALRLRAKEREHATRYGDDPDREGEFASDVHESFKHYFKKYTPPRLEPEVWLAATAGIRVTLRNEIVDLYRDEIVALYGDTKHRVGHVEWLIRYLVREVTNRRLSGTLRTYREQWRTRRTTKLLCVLSFAVVASVVVGVAAVVVPADPVPGGIAMAVLLLAGREATVRWFRIFNERRRFADDCDEYGQVLNERKKELQRWRDKLAAALPLEWEMEMWLTCDKTLLLDFALQHYKVAWRDVIAHAFLQTPARRYKRAHRKDRPWRYSRYDMRLFLITHDGVREYRAEFDFEHAVITRNERNNFRFDAVSSVGVIKTSELSYTLKLRLNNGPPSRIRITEAAKNRLDTEHKMEEFSEINLDAAGFKPTLHILEGIAAEGKGWIERDPQAGSDGPPPPTDVF